MTGLTDAGIPVSMAAGVVLDEAKALGVAGLLVARQVHLRAAAVLLKHVPQRAHIIVVLQDTWLGSADEEAGLHDQQCW